MSANHAFHFLIYRRSGAEVLLSLADSLWLQIGPFMRVVFGRMGTTGLDVDHHAQAIAALSSKDAAAAYQAIAADLAIGMEAMRAAVEQTDRERPND
jgi:DNA-binding GntR family transcriptional regulator